MLGCTHYPFIAAAIERYFSIHFRGEHRLFDGNAGTVRQLERVLKANGLMNDSGCANVDFYTSGSSEHYKPIFERFLKLPIYGE